MFHLKTTYPTGNRSSPPRCFLHDRYLLIPLFSRWMESLTPFLLSSTLMARSAFLSVKFMEGRLKPRILPSGSAAVLPVHYDSHPILRVLRIRIFPSRIPVQTGNGSRILNKELKYFYPKNCYKHLGFWLGMIIPDPGSGFFPIPDPGVKSHRTPDPGSATLHPTSLYKRCAYQWVVRWLPVRQARVRILDEASWQTIRKTGIPTSTTDDKRTNVEMFHKNYYMG